MGLYIQVLGFVIVGIVLLWFGYSLFFGKSSPIYFSKLSKKNWSKDLEDEKGIAGDPQVCPLCSIRLVPGQKLKSEAFPSVSGGFDRLMHIHGCFSCLEKGLPRRCPICGESLDLKDFLITRMFERANRNNHVHILGCNHCKKTGVMK
jgi:uncharacterized protein with PIN domain